MKGDFSRITFVALKRYLRVLMQQGRVQLDADSDETQDILKYLLKYLAAHPDAQDTLPGIVQWWLPQHSGALTARRVRGVLEELAKLGLVVCKRLPDGCPCYRLNRRKASAISRSARAPRKKKEAT